MSIQEVVSSPRAMRLGMFVSRYAPEGVIERLALLVAWVVCQAKPAAYRIVQANLSQVLGPAIDRQTLEHTTRHVFYMLVRSHYDLYRAIQLPRQELIASIDFPETAQSIVRNLHSTGKGTLLVFPHLSSFDLGGQVLAAHVAGIQLISLPNPPPGFQLANELRRLSGIEVTPLSPAALRQAILRLRAGGVVATAIDRPVSALPALPACPACGQARAGSPPPRERYSAGDDPFLFFSRPARVPSGHVRLAMKTDAQIVVACCVRSPQTQRYSLWVESPLDLIQTGDRDEELQINMRRVLDRLEAMIRRWPEQWLMFVPVWPELLKT